jgi:hypothetical protein
MLVPLFAQLWLQNRLQSDFDNHSANQNLGSIQKFVQNNNPSCIQGMEKLSEESSESWAIHADACAGASDCCEARS